MYLFLMDILKRFANEILFDLRAFKMTRI